MKTLRVVSFNVWSDAPRHSRWAARAGLVVKAILDCRPDLAGLQEPTAAMLEDLQRGLPGFRWIGSGRDDGDRGGEFNPIFYREDRFDLIEHATFWLAPDCASAGRGWDAACRRIVTWARFFDRNEGCEIVHFNTHFDHFGHRARRHSAQRLIEAVAERGGASPVVVTGDLNCRESSAAHRILTGAIPFAGSPPRTALHDTYYASEQPRLGPRRTFRGLLGHFGLGRIDYIFTNDRLRTLRHEVMTDCGKASDHWPVIAELAYRPA